MMELWSEMSAHQGQVSGSPSVKLPFEEGASASVAGSEPLPLISVCIATHRRPIGLRRLLESLVAQREAPTFEAIVVDNDAAGSGREVVQDFSTRLQITYLLEPTRGLARVRNRAVRASRGGHLAFIDDDEWATEIWLSKMWDKVAECDADIIVGPVVIEFDPTVPDYIRDCSLFRRADLADGKPVSWHNTHTSNSLVRKSALPDDAAPFDPAFDLTGGEDSDLFFRMMGRGATAIGAAKATVFEHRAARRANVAWVWTRALRNGNNKVALEWKDLRPVRRLSRSMKTLQSGLVAAFNVATSWFRNKPRAMRHLILMADNFGQLWGALGFKVYEYRVHQ